MSTIPENSQLLKHLFELIKAHRPVFKQQRVYTRAVALFLAEIFVFARHTMTQLLMTPELMEQEWSAWYRLFSEQRFDYDKASEILFCARVTRWCVGLPADSHRRARQRPTRQTGTTLSPGAAAVSGQCDAK